MPGVIWTIIIVLCRYSKDENLKPGDDELLRYTHVLVEQRSKFPYDDEEIHETHDFLEHINCFHSIGLEYQSYFPIKIKTRPCIGIAKRKKAFARPFEEPKLPAVDVSNDEDPIQPASIVVESTLKPDYQEIPSDEEEFDSEEPTTNDSGINEDESTDEMLSEEIEHSKKAYQRLATFDDFDEDEIYMSNENDINLSNENDANIPYELFDSMVNSEEIEDIFTDDKHVEEPSLTPAIEPDDRKSKADHRKRAKQTKMKLKKVIELYYQSKGQVIETESNNNVEIDLAAPKASKPIISPRKPSAKTNIKSIIKAEKIKQLVERISTLDLKAQCDLEILSAKDCLVKLIDEYEKEWSAWFYPSTHNHHYSAYEKSLLPSHKYM